MTIGFLLRRIDCNNGIASHLETLIRELKRAGVEIVLLTGPVYCQDTARERYESLKAISKDWILLELPSNRKPVGRSAMSQVVAAVKEHDIKVLHIHGLSMLPLARLSLGIARIPIVATAHPSGTSTLGPGKLTKTFIRLTKPLLRRTYLPDHAIAISSALEQWFINDLGMNPDRVSRIFHGVDADYFRPPSVLERIQSRRYFGFGDDDVVCSLVGRYEPVKRHDLLINSIKDLAVVFPLLKGLLVGSGGNEKSIKALIEENELSERIKMHGLMDARTVYWASDILVLPSEREGFPLVVVEAMLCGVMAIRTEISGATDQIQAGTNGLIFPRGNQTALTDHLKKLCNHEFDRVKMGRAASIFAGEHFTTETMVAKTLSVYNALAGRLRDKPSVQPSLA